MKDIQDSNSLSAQIFPSSEQFQKALIEVTKSLRSNQISQDPQILQQYGKDWLGQWEPLCRLVVWPESYEDVQFLARWSYQFEIPLIPSGGRTGLSGGATARRGEVVVSFERLNRILEFNPVNQTITCQAGTITQILHQQALEKGFFFPIEFAAMGSSQLGGNVATNAGGLKVIRYGMMRDWVAGLKVVTAQGDLIDLNFPLVKDASGYDLKNLFIGSEGTLGMIVEVTVKVTQPPPPPQVLLLALESLSNITPILLYLRKQASVSAFEFFSDLALDFVLEAGHVPALSLQKSPYYVLIELSGSDEAQVLSVFEHLFDQGWVNDGILSQSTEQAQQLWKYRELISESLAPHMPYKNDISVPIDSIERAVEKLQLTLKEHYPQFQIVQFGHIGDGNIHINILKPKDMALDSFQKFCHQVDPLIFSVVQSFRGSLSAEHGVGILKKPYLSYRRSALEINLMRQIKAVFDPKGLLNPGKIFD